MTIESKSCVWVQSTAIVLLLCLLVVTGCSSITPYPPRDNREEGPERGIFTGSKGEFVIPMPGEPKEEKESPKKKSEKSSTPE
jgi:hypothetical protein